MQLLAAEGIHQHQLNVQKSTRFIGIKVGKSNYSKNELNETKLPVRVIAQTAKTRSGWDTVLEGTEFKTTLSGADIQAGVGEKARADAKFAQLVFARQCAQHPRIFAFAFMVLRNHAFGIVGRFELQ